MLLEIPVIPNELDEIHKRLYSKITEVSDDSTNSIVAVEATGLGYEGRWVAQTLTVLGR